MRGLMTEHWLSALAVPTLVLPSWYQTTTPRIGIAGFPCDGGSLEALFKSADVALYEAKHAAFATLCSIQILNGGAERLPPSSATHL